MREYEMVLVFRPDLEQEEVPSVLERITSFITTSNGEVGKVDRWGRRKLAYPIKKYAEGDYVLTQFRLEPDQVQELEASLRLNEALLRHLVVRTED